jgi:hypothetical protein
MILAFAARTASILACWSFGRGVFLSSPSVAIMVGSWFRAVELCSWGCTLIGPIDGDLLLAIRANSLRPSSFDGSLKSAGSSAPILLGPVHSCGVATGCRKVNMQVVDIRRREQLFYYRFDLLPVD